MSTPSRFLRGSRALLAAAKSAASTPKPTKTAASTPKPAKAAASKPAKAAAAAGTRKTTKTAAPALPKEPKKKRTVPDAGIMKSIPVSLALQDFVGAPETSRAEAVKKIWAYIKENNLQNPADKKEILCDGKLKTVLAGREKVGFLEIGKLLSPHFLKTD